MKTWEMFKALTENPKLRFECASKDVPPYIVHNDHGLVKGLNQYIDMNFASLDLEWKPIREPVSFMEAVEIDKPMKPHGSKCEFMMPRKWFMSFAQGGSNYAISEMKHMWEIEDGD